MKSGPKTIFSCSHCGAQSLKWSGRCLECGSWGTIAEEILDARESQAKKLGQIKPATVVDLEKIKSSTWQRRETGNPEFDRVLGGGLVLGSFVLLSGEPGIGKSTLAAQLATSIKTKNSVLYASGEESALQVKNRFERLASDLSRLKFIADTNIEKIIASAKKEQPELLIIDSVQTVYSSQLSLDSGGVSQIKAVTAQLLTLAKENNITVILIGHITKDGQVAGPKSLEHMVDTVLLLESEPNYNYSLLRATKNRFGSVNELGILQMTAQGFIPVSNPSEIFIDDKNKASSGSALGCILEGSRPFIIDLQALVSTTVFGYPQRKTSGFELSRLAVISAVISKRTKINLLNQDILLNVAGGLRVSDPALDLAATSAIISSYLNQEIKRDLLFLGELGLGGEIRNVVRLEERLKEGERLGFREAFIPDVVVKNKTMKLTKITDINQLLTILNKK